MLILLTFLIIIIFLIILINNKNIKENFDIYGAQPRGSDWGFGIGNNNSDDKKKNCNPGFLCNTENSFGLYDKDCNCVTLNINNDKKKNKIRK